MTANEEDIQAIVRRVWTEMGTSFSPVELGVILDYMAADPEVTRWLRCRNGDLRDQLFKALKDGEVFAKIRTTLRLAEVEFAGSIPSYLKEAIDKAYPTLETHMKTRDTGVPCPMLVSALETFSARTVIYAFQNKRD